MLLSCWGDLVETTFVISHFGLEDRILVLIGHGLLFSWLIGEDTHGPASVRRRR